MSESLIQYSLHLADNSLILGQRNSEWCGHGPVLEQDIAITNISLDLIGQARNFYQYAAQLINESKKSEGCLPSPLERVPIAIGMEGEVTEDTLAYLRTERQFKNCLLVELPNNDWAQTTLRQYLFSQFQYLFYQQLQKSKDEQLAAIAAKSLKEVTYHLRWSSEWVIRLGDGTVESHNRMLKAIDELWRYTGELFECTMYEVRCTEPGIGIDVSKLKEPWMKKVKEIFEKATLPVPVSSPVGGSWMGAGKDGRHTEHLGFILAELQYIQRAYPGCEW
jgi:ring-1,2-phenylacetyl-CoA epoxidase subunit PaaC